ncbi:MULTISPECIES: hypothetical protein [unclassified Actinoplanes]|uniref:hypothetical protein n=1 Tax=unclassified Actinoplanes TaxID=2626549 RepID=UPI0012F909E8|nr:MULTISPECIES: hypothetical protein [unclassified Actinoplanes]
MAVGRELVLDATGTVSTGDGGRGGSENGTTVPAGSGAATNAGWDAGSPRLTAATTPTVAAPAAASAARRRHGMERRFQPAK